MVKLATPVSHLFENKNYESVILKNSDLLECRDKSIDYANNLDKQELFHCDLQPIHEFSSDDLNSLIQIKSDKPNLKLISFHLASCYEKPKVIKGIFYPQGIKLSVEELKYNAKVNIEKIKQISMKLHPRENPWIV